jgi:hypothetical protein
MRKKLVTLILCLCFGSLVILPLLNVVGLSIPVISGLDLGDYNLIDHSEFDEDFIVGPMIGNTTAEQIFSPSRPMNLEYQTASSSPDSPPPEHA